MKGESNVDPFFKPPIPLFNSVEKLPLGEMRAVWSLFKYLCHVV